MKRVSVSVFNVYQFSRCCFGSALSSGMPPDLVRVMLRMLFPLTVFRSVFVAWNLFISAWVFRCSPEVDGRGSGCAPTAGRKVRL